MASSSEAQTPGEWQSGAGVLALGRILWRYRPFYASLWPRLLLILLLAPLAGTVISAAGSLWTVLLMDEAFPRRSFAMVAGLVTAIFATGLLAHANNLIQDFMRYSIKAEVLRRLGARFYQKLMTLSLGFHEAHPVGERIYRASGDVTDTSHMLGVSLPIAAAMTLQSSVTLLMTAMIDWRPMVVILIFLPPYFFLAQHIATRWRVLDRRRRENQQEVTAQLQATLAAVHVVQASTQERGEKARYTGKLARYLRSFFQWLGMNAISEAYVIPAGLASIFATGTGLLCGILVITGELTVGQWLALQILISGALIPAASVVMHYQTLRRELVSAERVLEILDTPPAFLEPAKGVHPLRLDGAIELRDVSFSYPGSPPLLKDLSLRIEPGEKVAFVGPSGCGKTTLLGLLLRFHEPDSGTILVDGWDLRDLDLDAYRRKTGVVLQDPRLFAGTMRDNLTYGCPSIGEGSMCSALEAADCTGFVEQLPLGLDTPMAEKGDLSGGQKQRLTLARALVRHPDLLILDEPLSALDAQTGRKVSDALEWVAQDTTVVMATHRPASSCNVDRIFVIENGRISDTGTHEELREREGWYRRAVLAGTGRSNSRETVEYAGG